MDGMGIWERGAKEIKEKKNKGWRWRYKTNDLHQNTKPAPALKVMTRWYYILRFFRGLTWQDVKVTGHDPEAIRQMWRGHSENTETSTIMVKPPKFDPFTVSSRLSLITTAGEHMRRPCHHAGTSCTGSSQSSIWDHCQRTEGPLLTTKWQRPTGLNSTPGPSWMAGL
jgi:hypothetical protein